MASTERVTVRNAEWVFLDLPSWRYRGMTPHQSWARFRCCSTFREHLEHIAHLRRCHLAAEDRKKALDESLQHLVEALRKPAGPQLRLVKGGRDG